jgi:hypothetical protein
MTTLNQQVPLLRTAIVWRWFTCLTFVLYVCAPCTAFSQTPSPLQVWQYPGGTTLEKLYDPTSHWLINSDSAWNRLTGSASDSPITQSTL